MESEKRTLKSTSVVAKFVFHKSEMRGDGRVKGRNLSPRANESLSVSEVDGLSEKEICKHGRKYVDNPIKDRRNLGYCQYPADCLSDIGIEVDYDNEPPRHVSLIFPEDLARNREVAMLLERQALKLLEGAKPFFVACR